MTNFVTLFCLEDESAWRERLRRLAALAGVSPEFRESPAPPRDIGATEGLASVRSGGSSASAAGGGLELDGDYPPPPPNWVPPAGGLGTDWFSGSPGTTSESLALTSPRAAASAPRGAVVVSLAGDGIEAGLVLPQDEAQVLNLLTSQGEEGLLVGVHGLAAGVNSTLVAALLAGAMSEVFEESPRGDWDDEFAFETPVAPGDRGVCLVDFTGSTLPLSSYLAPVSGNNCDWRDLVSPGLPAPARLAGGLPRWGEVAVLSGSGFLERHQRPQAEAVLRGLRRAFSLVIVDFGSGKSLVDCPEAAEVWVGHSERASVLAWEDLPLPLGPQTAREVNIHLVCQPFGGLSAYQAGLAMELVHLDYPVFYPGKHPKDEKLWQREGIVWPPTKRTHAEYLQWAKELWNDLNCDEKQSIFPASYFGFPAISPYAPGRERETGLVAS